MIGKFGKLGYFLTGIINPIYWDPQICLFIYTWANSSNNMGSNNDALIIPLGFSHNFLF